MKVSGKTFVVTGAGSGMGRAITHQLLQRGARVAAVDLNETTLEETVQLAQGPKDRISMHVANIVDKKRVDALPAEVQARHGGIVDGLFNNAGIIQPFVVFSELPFDAIERVLNVNLYGVIYMTKAFLPVLLERPEAHIINTSSMGGFLPVPGQAMYGASKAAVKLLTEALYAELLETGVRVTVVFPGAIATNIGANSGVTLPGGGEPAPRIRALPAEEAARIILDAVERNKFRVLVGPDARLMDFLYRLSPRRAVGIIRSQLRSLLAR